jgi:hypothetical protein
VSEEDRALDALRILRDRALNEPRQLFAALPMAGSVDEVLVLNYGGGGFLYLRRRSLDALHRTGAIDFLSGAGSAGLFVVTPDTLPDGEVEEP